MGRQQAISLGCRGVHRALAVRTGNQSGQPYACSDPDPGSGPGRPVAGRAQAGPTPPHQDHQPSKGLHTFFCLKFLVGGRPCLTRPGARGLKKFFLSSDRSGFRSIHCVIIPCFSPLPDARRLLPRVDQRRRKTPPSVSPNSPLCAVRGPMPQAPGCRHADRSNASCIVSGRRFGP